jgi:hypothetical protein
LLLVGSGVACEVVELEVAGMDVVADVVRAELVVDGE